MADLLAARRHEQERLLALARDYLSRLSARLPVVAAAVVGSVARGDFNVWSDVDVVVVARELPARLPERSALLAADRPGRLEPVGFLPQEFEVAWRKGNPLAKEAVERGIPLAGEELFRRLRAAVAVAARGSEPPR